MYCTKCGALLPDTARFCTVCGHQVGSELPGPTPPPGWDTPPASVGPRKLRRIPAQKKIAGVCAGFAEYFDMDVTLMRIIWVALLMLPPGIGLIAYIVSWVVLPKE